VAEIEITLPTVQYGNVKVRATPEELGLTNVASASDLGVAAAVYVNLFTQGFKVGAALDVEIDAATGGAVRQPEVGSPEAAAQRVDDDLKPRTVDEANAMVAEVIKRELGATVIEETDVPWEGEVDASPKPWENGGNKPTKVAEIDW
jgi:hypothetical protein